MEYEPTARFAPFAGAINGKFYVWGGATKNRSVWESKEYKSSVEVFDPVTRMWTKFKIGDDSPTSDSYYKPPIYGGTSASANDCLYIHSTNGSSLVFKLDSTLKWTEVGPYATSLTKNCKMIVCGTIISLYGGYLLSTDTEDGYEKWKYELQTLTDGEKSFRSKSSMHSILSLL